MGLHAKINAFSITQSNCAKCHNTRSAAHRNMKEIRRTASKIRRQLLNKEVRDAFDLDRHDDSRA